MKKEDDAAFDETEVMESIFIYLFIYGVTVSVVIVVTVEFQLDQFVIELLNEVNSIKVQITSLDFTAFF